MAGASPQGFFASRKARATRIPAAVCKERATTREAKRTAARRVVPKTAWGFVARQSQPAAGMLLPRASLQAVLGTTKHQPIVRHHTSSPSDFVAIYHHAISGLRPYDPWCPPSRGVFPSFLLRYGRRMGAIPSSSGVFGPSRPLLARYRQVLEHKEPLDAVAQAHQRPFQAHPGSTP